MLTSAFGRQTPQLFHGHGVRVRRDVVRQDQDRGLAGPHEIARHGEHEVGAPGVHVRQEVVHHVHGDVGLALCERDQPFILFW